MFATCRQILISHPVRRLALVLLCLPYLISGIHKILDFGAGVGEMSSNGLLPPAPYAAVTVIIQIGCSILVITGFLRWLAALALAAFTVLASIIAEPFWRPSDGDYIAMLQAFSEHLGLVGAWLLVAWYTLHKFKNKGQDDWL